MFCSSVSIVQATSKMADKMFLYWASGSPPCWRLMLALEEKGLSGYPNKLIAFDKNEHKSEEILKWNPRGQVITAFFMILDCL
jgi:Glutathione S-transferase, N-terminal domain